MTNRIRSSRRLITTGAALLVAAALTIVLGVVPPIRSDTFALAAPASASAGFMVQAGIAVLLALALGLVAVLAAGHLRASVATLHVIAALVFLLAMSLGGLAPAFVVHGPALRLAIFFMALSAAAALGAVGLVVAAASRLSGPATSEDMGAWKTRIVPAALLGIGSFFLVFLLGYGIQIPASVPAADYVSGFLITIAMGGYSLLATYVLSRGLPRARRNLWLVLALNAVLLLTVPIILFAEPGNTAALQLLVVVIVTSACSYGGLTLAARPRASHDKPAGHQA